MSLKEKGFKGEVTTKGGSAQGVCYSSLPQEFTCAALDVPDKWLRVILLWFL